MVIDIIDEKLLEVLQDNARISISELSKRINLSLSAVSDRLKKLEASGIINQYTAILDSKKLEKNILAIMFVSIDNTLSNGDFIKMVKAEHDVIECERITGDYDYFLRLSAKNQAGLQSLIDKIKSNKNISKTRVDILLEDVKRGYSVSPHNIGK